MMNETIKCERCTSPLWPDTIQEDYVYEGETYTIDVDYSVCGFCGYEVITTEQIKINDDRLRKVWSTK